MPRLPRLLVAVLAVVLWGVYSASAVAADSSGGSGGPFTDRTNVSFTASNGLTSKYHVYAAGLPRTAPVGLLLQFHGDGAYEFNNPTSSYSLGGTSGIVAQARRHGMITVPVLTPDTVGSVTWWESGSQNADFVRDLLRYLFTQYDVDTGRIWLVGYSGGAQFVTQFFLPKYSSLIGGGGAVVFGGGGVPRVTVQPFAAGLVGAFPMHWYTGLLDDGRGGTYNALADARAGSAWYANRGFRTSLATPSGVGHALSGRFGAVVGAQLDLYDRPSASPTPAPTLAPTPTPTPTSTPAPPAPGVASPAPVGRANDFTGDGHNDLLARRAGDGSLWLYPGTGTGSWQPRVQVGSGWQVMDVIDTAGDFSGDGRADVLAREVGSGRLWLYPGNGSGGWDARILVGSGWQVMDTVLGPGDFSGDGAVDVLARVAGSGALVLYPGDGRGGWLAPVQVGSGWQGMDLMAGPGDLTGDGAADVLAREASTGTLWLYPRSTTGGWLPRVAVGTAWQTMNALA